MSSPENLLDDVDRTLGNPPSRPGLICQGRRQCHRGRGVFVVNPLAPAAQ
jgi:hypothetical protein